MQFIQGFLRLLGTYLILAMPFFSYGNDQIITIEECVLAHIKQHAHMTAACLFPRARNQDDKVKEIIESYATIAYQKDFVLEFYGPRNFLSLIYDGEEWIEVDAYLSSKVDNCFNVLLGTWPMRVYFIVMDDCTKVLECKRTIRSLFDLETHSIHMTDTQPETVRLAQQLLTPGGIDRLNDSIPIK